MESAWSERVKLLSTAILDRLDIDALKPPSEQSLCCFLSGFGCEVFAEELSRKLHPTPVKLFINLPDGSNNPLPKDYVVLKGGFEEKLSAFPPNAFGIIISLWGLSATQPQHTLKTIWRGLKKGGQFALVISLDGSPKLPLQIISRVIRERASLGLKLYRSALPSNVSGLRKLLEKTGFFNPRIWSETMIRHYPDGNSLFDDLIARSEHGLFDDKVDPSNQSFIRNRFVERIESHRSPTEPKTIAVKFDLACAVGVK